MGYFFKGKPMLTSVVILALLILLILLGAILHAHYNSK